MSQIEVFIACFSWQIFRYKKYKKQKSPFYYGNYLKT